LKVIHSFSWGKSTTDPLTLKHNLLPINQNIVGEGNSKENNYSVQQLVFKTLLTSCLTASIP
jgi:hypothetical protein